MINMHFSFSSVLIAILASNLILIFITAVLYKKKFFLTIGYPCFIGWLSDCCITYYSSFRIAEYKKYILS